MNLLKAQAKKNQGDQCQIQTNLTAEGLKHCPIKPQCQTSQTSQTHPACTVREKRIPARAVCVHGLSCTVGKYDARVNAVCAYACVYFIYAETLKHMNNYRYIYIKTFIHHKHMRATQTFFPTLTAKFHKADGSSDGGSTHPHHRAKSAKIAFLQARYLYHRRLHCCFQTSANPVSHRSSYVYAPGGRAGKRSINKKAKNTIFVFFWFFTYATYTFFWSCTPAKDILF